MDFKKLLDAFAHAVAQGDGPALAALFTPDGVYDDYFFGPHRGADAIAHMLARFYEGGKDFRWEFYDLLSDASGGYARYRFSYRAKEASASGRPVLFEGMSRFHFDGDRIAAYAEVFDRGAALAQQDYDAGRLKKILQKYAAALHAPAQAAPHRSTGD